MKLRATMSVLFLVLGSLAAAWPAGAQILTGERVQFAIGVTDSHIERAEVVVSNSNNATAQSELALAVDLQARAKGAFAAVPPQLAVAMRLTLDARGHADRAIAIVQGLPDPDRVTAQLDRTREILDRARTRTEECQNDRARALLRAAFDMQARAEGAAQEGRYLMALQLTMSARERGFRALRICNVTENLEESAERALQRTDEVLARTRDAVSDRGDEGARQALARGEELEVRAWAEFRAEHFEASLRLTQSARAFANRALRLAGGRR